MVEYSDTNTCYFETIIMIIFWKSRSEKAHLNGRGCIEYNLNILEEILNICTKNANSEVNLILNQIFPYTF